MNLQVLGVQKSPSLSTRTKLFGYSREIKKKAKLPLEFAAVTDWSYPFVKVMYSTILKEIGPFAVNIETVGAAVGTFHIPNVQAIA